MGLQLRFNNLQAELRASAELEKLRVSLQMEQLRNEMEWKTKTMQEQLMSCKALVHAEQLEKMKLERMLKTMRLQLEEREHEFLQMMVSAE